MFLGRVFPDTTQQGIIRNEHDRTRHEHEHEHDTTRNRVIFMEQEHEPSKHDTGTIEMIATFKS